MTKTKRAASKPTTHFKLVPLDVVKMMALPDESKPDAPRPKRVTAQPKREGRR